MILRNRYLLITLVIFFLSNLLRSQNRIEPVAKFSFNNRSDSDEVNGNKISTVGVNYCEDRFGNSNNALYVYGNEYSYISLGSYSALKQKVATISLWVKIEREVWAGTGYNANPIILTKSRSEDDFFEAYAIYYQLQSKKLSGTCARDSLSQMGSYSKNAIKLFQWYHLVLTYDDDYFSLYLNGDLQRKATKNFQSIFLEGDSVLIGFSANRKNKRYMEGAVDDITFFDRILSDEEIEQLYNAPNPNRNKVFFNWTLLGIAILIVISFIYLIVRHRLNVILLKQKQKLELSNKMLETELRVNRALMNPHFVFNSLNALQNFILKNENKRANNYLVKFSKLMRKILESNMSDMITLEMEIELLDRYLEIEDLRFEENVKHTITLEPNIIASSIYIPIMMLQPFVENAIWHGLLKKEGERILKIHFLLNGTNSLKCVIEDNGTGRAKHKQDVLQKKSLATGFVIQRLELLNRIHGLECSLDIIDKPNNQGTIIEITLPILK